MKPYPAYKDSGIEWLGEIPEHWGKIKLRYIADVFGGSTPSSSNKDYWNGDIPWVTTDDLGKLKGKIIRKTRRTISKTGLASISKILTPNGSIIISNRAPIGHLGILGIDACTNQGCKSIVLSNVVNKFIYYYLQSTKDKINSLGKGTTFKELSTNDLKGYQFPLPSKPEQTQIATFLDHKTQLIDNLIEKKEKLVKLLKEERTAFINQAVTKGLPAEARAKAGLDPNVPMKDSGIEWLGEIPGHWELKPLKHVAHINLEKLEENTDPDYEFKYVDIGNVSFGQINGLPYIMKFKDAPSRARRIIRKGNTILSTVRTYLKSITFIDESLDGQVASTGFAIISAKSKLIDKYLFFITSSNVFIETVCSISVGVSYPATNSVDISQIKVWIPSISEQTAIVHYIENEMSRINNVGDKIKKEIDLIKEYKTSLINEAVTGKIDVREYKFEGNLKEIV